MGDRKTVNLRLPVAEQLLKLFTGVRALVGNLQPTGRTEQRKRKFRNVIQRQLLFVHNYLFRVISLVRL